MQFPATSANLGSAFDCAAVAVALHLTVEAEGASEFRIDATGRDAEQCGKLEQNLILETYRGLLEREGRAIVPLALTMHNEIPLGMGCGSSAAGRLAAIALANHFGDLGWSSQQILEEASSLEGHPDNAAACWLGGLAVAACEGPRVHAARVEPPLTWKAMIVLPADPLATSRARAVLPAQYSRQDVVANIQAAALLGLAFAGGRGDLLRPAMADRIHQPYRAEICPLLPQLLPLAGRRGILGVALSGAGPSVLLIVDASEVEAAEESVRDALTEGCNFEVRVVGFEQRGAGAGKDEMAFGISHQGLG